MNKAINSGGVTTVSTMVNDAPNATLISTSIRHELAPEKLQELVAFLEPIILRAITIWTKL